MWPDNLLLESGGDLLMESGGLLLLELQPDRPGGNLVKPRLHQGNAPGPKTQYGEGEIHRNLTITGYGTIESPGILALPTITCSGELTGSRALHHQRRTDAVGTICASARIDASSRSYAGVASEDLMDLLILDLLPRSHS